jgi:hypothetical protein
VIVIRRFHPDLIKLAKVHGLSNEDAEKEVLAGRLSLPESLPLSPEEALQAFEDELFEAMCTPVPPDYFGQTL